MRTFGVLFGKRIGSFIARAGEVIAGTWRLTRNGPVAETLINARASILDQIKVFDGHLTAVARATPMVRLFKIAPTMHHASDADRAQALISA